MKKPLKRSGGKFIAQFDSNIVSMVKAGPALIIVTENGTVYRMPLPIKGIDIDVKERT